MARNEPAQVLISMRNVTACSNVCVAARTFSKPNAKFESGTGWPSFFKPADDDAVSEHKDRKFFMTRTEIAALIAMPILAMCFPTVPSLPGCAIA